MYLWHKASHRFDCLWMFHRVHHNDPYLNISTAFRVHVLELFITFILKAILVIIFGIEQTMLLTNEAMMTFFIMFHHTNISFKGEKLLGHVIIVPSLTGLTIQRNGESMIVTMALFYRSGIGFSARYQS